MLCFRNNITIVILFFLLNLRLNQSYKFFLDFSPFSHQIIVTAKTIKIIEIASVLTGKRYFNIRYFQLGFASVMSLK